MTITTFKRSREYLDLYLQHDSYQSIEITAKIARVQGIAVVVDAHKFDLLPLHRIKGARITQPVEKETIMKYQINKIEIERAQRRSLKLSI